MKQKISIALLSASVFLAHSADDRNPVAPLSQGLDTRRTMIGFDESIARERMGALPTHRSAHVFAPINFDTIVDDVDTNCSLAPFAYHDPAPAPYPDLQVKMSSSDFAAPHDQLNPATTKIKMASLLLDELFFFEKFCPTLLAPNNNTLWKVILDRIENQKEGASSEKLVELNAFQQFILQRQSHEQTSRAHPLLGTSLDDVD